jgi:hypothetical protein
MFDAPQDEDVPPFGVGWTAGCAPDEETLDREVGETSVEAFSCLLLDAAVTLELVQAMSRGSESAITILGVLRPYIASIEGMRIAARGRSMPVLRRRRVLPAAQADHHRPSAAARLRGSGNRSRHGHLRTLHAQGGLAAAGLEGRYPRKDDAGAAEGVARLPIDYAGPWARGEGVDAGHPSSRHSLRQSPQTSSAHASASALLTMPVSNR